MRRHLLGIIALSLLAIAAYFWLFVPDPQSAQFIHGSCVKAGAVLAAIWLAYPQLEKLPDWLFLVMVGVAVFLAVRPRAALVLLQMGLYLSPVLFLLWGIRRLFQPASSGKSSRRQRTSQE